MESIESRTYFQLALLIDEVGLAQTIMEEESQKSFEQFDAAFKDYAVKRVKVKAVIDFVTFTLNVPYGQLAKELEKYDISREELDTVYR